MKVSEIREMAPDQMLEKIEKLKRELLDLRIQFRTGKLEKNAVIRGIKRDIARIFTILKEEERKAELAATS